ncbi:hypothetical protein ACFLWR_04700 [Chloroflexota bacterium]
MLKTFLISCVVLLVIGAILLGVAVVQATNLPVTFAMVIALGVILLLIFIGLGIASLVRRYRIKRQ